MDLSGKTALLTGASAGIGQEIAYVLAREVSTLILVARRKDRLDKLSAELTAQQPNLRVLVFAVDLLDKAATHRMIDELLKSEHIDVLVNNAGFGVYGDFHESTWDSVEQMLELNVVSATLLLHRLIPGMVSRGSGAILNIGSSAGMVGSPGMMAYAATKAYLNLLSEGIRAELANTGVTVTLVCPGPVPTEFQQIAGERRTPMPEFFHVDARACAEQSVEAMKAGRPRVVPGLAMRAAVVSLEAIPKVLVRPVLKRMAAQSRR